MHQEFRFSLPAVNAIFFRSLLLSTGFAAVLVSVSLVTEIIFVDFVHENHNRTQQNAIEMLFFQVPLMAAISALGILIVFTAQQFFQATSTALLIKYVGSRGIYGAIILIPLMGVLSWYCCDYLAPTDFNLGINSAPDWTPYQHGLTLERYMVTLGFQAPISAFSLLRFRFLEQNLDKARKALMLAVFAVCIVGGMILGYKLALNQYKFL